MKRIPLALLPLLVLAVLTGAEDDPAPFPAMAAQVGEQLEKHYYDRSRVQPQVMVERALRSLEGAEIAIDTAYAGDVIVLNVGGTRTRVPAPRPSSLGEAMAILDQVRKGLAGSDFTPKRRRDLDYALINGALSSLDPHTLLLPPAPARDFMEDISGEFFGIGAFLTNAEGRVAIERVMPEFPADRAGVRDGDVILAVNGEKMAGLSLDQAVHRIKGPKGTTVVLTLERANGGQIVDVPVVRDLVSIITVRAVRLGDVGYVRMDDFYATTARDLYREITALKKQAGLRGLVLDLRNNGGGLLEQARLISNFFLAKGQEIVRTASAGQEAEVFTANGMPILDVPMIVLISPGSASAAEILSGALQINERAVIIGRTSFGKGSVQTVLPKLRDGSKLKVTIQEYQLRGGLSIQDVGVTPDVAFVRHAVREDGSVDLVPYTLTREADDEFSLENRNAYRHEAIAVLGWLARHVSREEAKRSALSARDFQPDQEALLAIELLQEALKRPDFDRRAAEALAGSRARRFLLDELTGPIAERSESEARALGEAVAQGRSVAWGEATPIDRAALTLAYEGPSELVAGREADLTFSLTNASSATMGRLYGVVAADRASPLWEEEAVFGEVGPGETVRASLSLLVPERLHGGEERFSLELRNGEDFIALARLPVAVRILPQPRPHLSLMWTVVDASGDGVIDLDEKIELELTVLNEGEGASRPIQLYVFKADDAHVQLGASRLQVPAIPPKAMAAPERVPFTVSRQVKRGAETRDFAAEGIRLQITAEEVFPEGQSGRDRANFYASLPLAVGRPLKAGELRQPRVRIVQPGIEELAPDRVRVNLGIVPADQVKFIALFQNEDKIALETGAVLDAQGRFQGTIALRPGLNQVRAVVTTVQDVSEVLPLRLWGPTPDEEGGALAGSATPAAVASPRRPAGEPLP